MNMLGLKTMRRGCTSVVVGRLSPLGLSQEATVPMINATSDSANNG